MLAYTLANEIEFVDGSASKPLEFPLLQTHTPDNAPNVIVMLADGTVKKWDPSSVGNNFLAYWDGTDWRINTLNNLLPSGQGIFIRDTSNNLVVVPNGVSGSSLQMVGTNIQFVAAPQNQFPGGHLYGMILSNNSADPNNDIDISIGECRSELNTVDLLLTSAITKRADAAWAAGNNQGGMDTGSKPTNGTLHVYIISNGSAVDAIFSQSASSPALPGGYTEYRRIGAVTTDSSSNIRRFVQVGDRFLYTAKPIADATALAISTTPLPITLTVPTGIKVRPLINFQSGAGIRYITSYDPDSTWAATNLPNSVNNGAGSVILQNASSSGSPANDGALTNTSRQLGFIANAATTIYIDTYGWAETRGRLQP